VVVLASYLWDSNHISQGISNIARSEARAYFNKDQAFRLWAASHGGVYVEPDERTLPNPYLAHIPERDVLTTGGMRLTLMNPAYILRQVIGDFSELYGIRGHITSLNPLRPENGPDEWEAKALGTFSHEDDEFFEITDMGDEKFLRLMRPIITMEQCLKCHAVQGYKVRDIRGGVSVSIPLAPLISMEEGQKNMHMYAHLVVWIVGLTGIAIASNRIAMHNMKETIAIMDARRKERFSRLLLDSTAEAIYGLDTHGNCTFCNPSCLRILGFKDEKELLGRNMHELIHRSRPDGSPAPIEECSIYRVYRTGIGQHRDDKVFYRADGSSLQVEYWSYPVFEDDTVIGAVVTFIDITKRKKDEEVILSSLKEKETLIREIHHRVKNNMAVISSILSLQAEQMSDREAIQCLRDCKGRIQAMALVHENLYQNRNLSEINVADYLHRLQRSMSMSLGVNHQQIEFRVDADDCTLNLDTLIPSGLIINELMSNAIKHAFPDGRKGAITVELRKKGESAYLLRISDNGRGLPQGLGIKNPGSLGLRLVSVLVGQIDGSLEVNTSEGTSYEISFNEISNFSKAGNQCV
jgi:PAS domain S-box-containing protein